MSERAAFVRARNRTFWGLLVGYGAFYLCRNNLSAASKLLESGLHIDKIAFGQIASTGTLCYAIGKVAAGPITDKIGGKRIFFVGLFASAIANLAMSSAWPLSIWIALWSISRLFQSMGWAGLVQIMPQWFPPPKYGTAMGAISTSYQLGSALTPLFFAGIIAVTTGWQALFWAPAIALIGIGLIVQRLIAQKPQDVGLPPVKWLHEQPPEDIQVQAWHLPLRNLLSRPRFYIVLGLSFSLTLIRETFNLWMPRYFSDLGAANAAAVLKSAAFPILGLAGTILAGWISDRFSNGRRGPIMILLLLGLVLSLLALSQLTHLSQLLNMAPQTLAVPLTGLIGFCLLGPYSMVGGGVVALDFGGKEGAATAAGLLDGVGYLGASLAGVGVGALVDREGWPAAWQVLGALGFVAITLCLPLCKDTRTA